MILVQGYGQDLRSLRIPESEIRVEAVWLAIPAVLVNQRSGPNSSFKGALGKGWGARTTYIRHLTRGPSIYAGLSLRQIPVSLAWNTGSDTAASGSIGMPNEASREPDVNGFWAALTGGVEHRILFRGGFHIGSSVGLGLSAIQMDRAYEVYAGVPGQALIPLGAYRVSINERGRLLPFIDLSASLGKRLRNWNVLGFRLFAALYASNHIRGEFIIKPGASEESRGTFSGTLSHFGVSVSYTMVWGAPKIPRYLQQSFSSEPITP